MFEVLGNPKVFGFIAMVSDTTITKVKGWYTLLHHARIYLHVYVLNMIM